MNFLMFSSPKEVEFCIIFLMRLVWPVPTQEDLNYLKGNSEALLISRRQFITDHGLYNSLPEIQ
jgi:hypothetical protein